MENIMLTIKLVLIYGLEVLVASLVFYVLYHAVCDQLGWVLRRFRERGSQRFLESGRVKGGYR